MENSKTSEAIKAGQARARAEGKHMGRPKAVFDRDLVVRLRGKERLSWPEIARRTGAGVGTVVRAYRARHGAAQPFQKLWGGQSLDGFGPKAGSQPRAWLATSGRFWQAGPARVQRLDPRRGQPPTALYCLTNTLTFSLGTPC